MLYGSVACNTRTTIWFFYNYRELRHWHRISPTFSGSAWCWVPLPSRGAPKVALRWWGLLRIRSDTPRGYRAPVIICTYAKMAVCWNRSIFISKLTSRDTSRCLKTGISTKWTRHVHVSLFNSVMWPQTGVWIDGQIYGTSWYSEWLYFIVHYCTQASVHSHLFTAVAWQRLPTSDVPILLGSRIVPVPHLSTSNSNSSQQLNSKSLLTATQIEAMLRLTVSRPVCLCTKHPSEAQYQSFITVRKLRVFWCGTPSLKRGRVCRLQLLPDLANVVIYGHDSRGTHDHVILSQIRYSLNLPDQVPVFVSPRTSVAQLHPQALGSLFMLPSTTRRATMEVFEPASTRDDWLLTNFSCL
jgi:hypothetical protein